MITSISTSYRNISNNFNPASFSLNRSDLSSNTSSMITGAESLILNSIRKNNKSLCFQKQNRKLKNDIKNLKKINIEHNSYRSLILQKSLVNLIKNGNNQSKFNENTKFVLKIKIMIFIFVCCVKIFVIKILKN